MGHGPYSMEGSARWRARAHGSSDEPLRGRLRGGLSQWRGPPEGERERMARAMNHSGGGCERSRCSRTGRDERRALPVMRSLAGRREAGPPRSVPPTSPSLASTCRRAAQAAQERCFGRRAHDARFKAERQSKPRRKDARSRRRPQRHPGEARVGNAQAMGQCAVTLLRHRRALSSAWW